MKNKILRYTLIFAVSFGLFVMYNLASGIRMTYAIYREAAMFSFCFTILWGVIVERSRKKRESEEKDIDMDFFDPQGVPNTIDEMVRKYGEPDAIIVTDGTRGMAPDCTVLVYDHGGIDDKGFISYDNLQINKVDITDITFHRDERPLYHIQDFTFPEKYEIMLNTTDDEHPKVFIKAGHDLELAKESALELRKHLLCE